MDPSVFHEIRTIDVIPTRLRAACDETIEQVILADQPGYRTAWFVEHHCLPVYRFCRGPQLVLTYLASKTKQSFRGGGFGT